MRATLAAWIILVIFPGFAAAQEDKPQNSAKAGVTVWDTGRASASDPGLAGQAGKNDWTVIPPGSTASPIQGDTVLGNGRIVAVVRKQDATVTIHGLSAESATAHIRLRLLSATGEPATRLERVAVVENGRASAVLEATYETAHGTNMTARFRLKRGDVWIQAEPGERAGKLRIECLGRFVVLPDFFADDITIDATRLPVSTVDLPSENFVLQPIADGNALSLCVFENRQHDVKVSLTGSGSQKAITGSEIDFEGKKVWVALLEGPQIWHACDLKPGDTGKEVRLDWKMPFAAQWRVDFGRPNDLTDSWEMLLQEKKDGPYVKPSWLGSGDETLPPNRSRWNTVLGRYPYPCWSDPNRQGYLQPLKSPVLQFAGPALIYPMNRVKQTPLDAFTVVDVMRNTLGVGPCEHILDLEGQKSQYKGRATCAVRDKLLPIYTSKQQKQKRAEVDRTLDEGLTFVRHIRGRITRYIEFGQAMRQYLAEQKKAHPELAGFVEEMDKLTQEINSRVAARVEKIKTPEHVAKMNEEFRKNVLDNDGPDALKNCAVYAFALVQIGDNQDELSGECRWVVKALRQRAGILMALDPRVAPIAMEIRSRTQEALRNPASHEGARH